MKYTLGVQKVAFCYMVFMCMITEYGFT